MMTGVLIGTVLGCAGFVLLVVNLLVQRAADRASREQAEVWQSAYERINLDAQRLAHEKSAVQRLNVQLAGRLEDMTRERDELLRELGR